MSDRFIGIRGGIVRVDLDDVAFIKAHAWYVLPSGYVARSLPRDYSSGRPVRGIAYLHRELLGLARGDRREGEHKNRNRLDNRRSNLLIVSHAQNAQNVSPQRGRSSRYRGVDWKKDKQRWRATVTLAGRQIHVGYFDNELAAASAASCKRQELMTHATD